MAIVRIGFLMLSHPQTRKSPVMPEVVRLLTEWGAEVQIIQPESHLLDLSRLRVEHDLYVLKAKSDIALSIAACLHAHGATILNSYPVSVTLRDKIVTFEALEAAGVPVPKTYVASRPNQLTRPLEDGPLTDRWWSSPIAAPVAKVCGSSGTPRSSTACPPAPSRSSRSAATSRRAGTGSWSLYEKLPRFGHACPASLHPMLSCRNCPRSRARYKGGRGSFRRCCC